MCGRYVSPDRAAIERAWHIGRGNSTPFRRRYNVLPTTQIPILIAGNDGGLELAGARWGLIPSWWKDAKAPQSTFNARAEEAADKPMWRYPYRHARCLAPAVGWYEWRTAEAIDKVTGEVRRFRQPYFIYPIDRGLICFAGLMGVRAAEGDGEQLSCAFLTRAAAGRLAEIHVRMPVVLSESVFKSWLSPDVKSPEDVAAMVGYARDDFEFYPVTTRLSAAKGDSEDFVRAIQ